MSIELAWLPELPEWAGLLQAARQESAVKMPSFTLQTTRPTPAWILFAPASSTKPCTARRSRRTGRPETAVPRHQARAVLGILHAESSPSQASGSAACGEVFLFDIYVGPYGLYRQELSDPNSALVPLPPRCGLLRLSTPSTWPAARTQASKPPWPTFASAGELAQG